MRVEIPLNLLEDIFRLLYCLDRLKDHDDLHFQRSGYSHRLERDNALRELRIKINQLHGRTLETYLPTVNSVTESEKHHLQKWVDGGNSVYDNPYSLSNERGYPMDFINALRAAEDMFNNPDDCICGTETGDIDFVGDIEDLPF